MEDDLVLGKVDKTTWTKYAQEIYRSACTELVFLDMGEQGESNKARSSKMAWLRKRLADMEPEQVAHAVRPYLRHRRDLDNVTAAWLPFVSTYVGPNDEYHDARWASLSLEAEKLSLSAGFELLKQQLQDSHESGTADLLLHGSFDALTGFNCQPQLVYRLLQPGQKFDFLQYAMHGSPFRTLHLLRQASNRESADTFNTVIDSFTVLRWS